MKSRLTVIGAALLILGLLCQSALAGPPTDYVKGILDEVLRIQNDPAQEKTRAQSIRRIIQKNFDFPAMAQESLGTTYGKLSSSQRQEFENIFSTLFQDSYTRLVINFLKRETIKYGQEKVEGDRARVQTTLVRTNETIPVEYLMRNTPGRSLILYDVIVDGVSILDNYKRQFAQVISTKSFDFLLDKMRTQYRSLQ